MMINTMRKLSVSSMFVLMLALFCSPAFADTTATYNLTVASVEIGGGTGQFGTVQLTLNGASIDVVVTGVNNWTFYGAIGEPIFGLNVTGSKTGLQVTACSVCLPTAAAFNQQLDGFGVFDVALQDGIILAAHPTFSFTLSRTSGFTDVNDIFLPNDHGIAFAAHATQGIRMANGYVGAVSTTAAVPEPTTFISLSSALLAFGFYRRKRI